MWSPRLHSRGFPMQACEGPRVNRTVVDYAFEGAYRFVYMIPQDAQKRLSS